MNQSQTHAPIEGIAVIGMAGRFPMSRDIEAFWHNLIEGVECITAFTDQELRDAGVDETLIGNPHYVKAKGVLEGVELFDASFFGLSPREAEVIDPQHRLFLESAWEALESAGYDPEAYTGLIGVYAGASINTYLIQNLLANPDFLSAVGGYQAMLGNDKDFMPTRVSYKLNLKGPSIDVQSACSTSVVAVQLACQSLLDYQCDMALAGGVSVTLPHVSGYLYQEGMILSPDGHCRAFDAQAQGTVGGEGVGIVVLKRLAEALADGDTIRAIIRGTAVNNDGSLKVGYTAPSVDGQSEAIVTAHAAARVDAESITYVETHGTGTSLGDPIEIAALCQAFRATTSKTHFCAIGSVKTNIGHLDAAAGVAGLIKTVLALEHKQLPPSLHYRQPNPKIDFDASPFYVNSQPATWETDKLPRRAGVSSFGIGGTNAHVIVEEAPEQITLPTSRQQHLLVLSAKTEPALNLAAQNLARHLRQHPDLNLADVAYTLQVGRRHFAHRRFVVCHDNGDAAAGLEIQAPPELSTAVSPETRNVAFMFTGQGSQYVNMALDLYRLERTFREQVDTCAELLEPYLGLDLRDVLYPNQDQAEWAVHQIHQTQITQPALFVVEYALARLWMDWGLKPKAMIGHSIGEYVAAALAGVLTLDDALRVVAVRGRLMQSLPSGAMLAVSMTEQEVRPLLGTEMSLAAINAPALCVISGPGAKVDALEGQLESKGVQCRRLLTSHAFHSAMMAPILSQYSAEVGRVQLHPPKIPFISNVTGTWITDAQATDPGYWVSHLRQTVCFADGMRELFKCTNLVLLEVGPGQTLSTLAQQNMSGVSGRVILSSLRHPKDPRSDAAFLLTALGRIWLAGVSIDWTKLYSNERRRRIPLPTYPFERQRYWVQPCQPATSRNMNDEVLMKRADIADWFYTPSWRRFRPPSMPKQGGWPADTSHWLIFANSSSLCREITQRLQTAGQTVVTVRMGSTFECNGDHNYCLNPKASDDYGALIRELRGQDKLPERILHFWCYSGTNATPVSLSQDALSKWQDLGFYSLLFLMQALGEFQLPSPLRIGIISSNVQEVTGEEILDPAKATVLGLCRVIPLEYPGTVCTSIDLPSPQSGCSEDERFAQPILADMLSKSVDPVVAYRGHYRWVQTFEATPMDVPSERPVALKENGTYLITGGLGGIGLVLADYLVRNGPVNLVLTGRSAIPPKEEWPRWLSAHDEHDPVSQRICSVQALEAMGAEVMVLRADVADLGQMHEVMTQIRERFGSLNGVIHAAGLPGGGMIQLRTPQEADKVMAPKLAGTVILDQLLSNQQLDFLALCSSINSVAAGIGQADYAAANAFLDAYAHYCRAKSGTWCVAINWDTWQEVGMAANALVPANLQWSKDENLKKGLLPKEGQDVFARILGNPIPQVVVSTRDLHVALARYNDLGKSARAQSNGPAQHQNGSQLPDPNVALNRPSAHHPRPMLATPFAAPMDDVQISIAGIWRDLLGIDPIGIFDDFFELGGHSLLAIQVISRIRGAYHVELPTRSLFEATTVQELALRLKTILQVVQDQRSSAPNIEADREEIEL